MAIKDEDQGNSAIKDAFQKAGAQTAQTGSAESSSTKKPNFGKQSVKTGGVMNINQILSRPISKQSTGAEVAKFQNAITELLKANLNDGFGDIIRVVVLDNNKSNVGPLSAILFCIAGAEKKSPGDHPLIVATFTLLVEASGGSFSPRINNFNGRNTEVDVVAGDVFNEYFWGRIQEHVRNVYGLGDRDRVIDAGAMTVPKDLSPDNEESIRQMMYYATQACYTVLGSHTEDEVPVFTVGIIDPQHVEMIARLDYNQGQATSATNEPVRSDVRIRLCAESKTNQNVTGQFERAIEICSVEGFVDLVYTPPEQQQFGQPMITQRYHPRFVMTRCDNEIDAMTMEILLLSIAQSTLLSRNMAWAGVFRPRLNVKGTDMRDIGAIGYEINVTGDPNGPMDRVDTKSSTFDMKALYQFLSMFIHDRLIFSMDVEETGDQSWITQAFLAAANGDQVARNAILQSCATLSDNRFDPQAYTGPICADNNNRIQLGYYMEGDPGKKRDLRDWDHLAMLNVVGKEDPSMVVKWADSFDKADVPIDIRLDDRRKVLSAILGNNVSITGYARRITFDPHFLVMLSTSLAAAGLQVKPSNVMHDFAGSAMRGDPTAAGFALGGQQVGNMFNYGNANQYGNHGQGSGHLGRFGRY